MISHNTIAAIATPIGFAGIGVIRISGPEALAVASRLFKPEPMAFPTHTAHHGSLIDPRSRDPIDDAVLTVFRAPKSYTGEDVIEISCHGGIAVLKSALGAALSAGARLAEPGEFTRRAFLNGRIDLAQAVAVNDLIRARTEGARKVALSQLDGDLSARVRDASDRILGVIASIEAAIDFPEDVPEPDNAWIMIEIEAAKGLVDGLVSSFGRGRIYREGLRVVIAGRVNVGKSSLLNALLRHARAIVTPIPGTTRDVIEESLEIHGIPIVAMDTAGLRPTEDPVERIGIELARKSVESAELVLLVIDAAAGIDDEDIDFISSLGETPMIVVLNKIDLAKSGDGVKVETKILDKLGRNVPTVETCVPTGEGIDKLETAIAEVAASIGAGSEGAMVSNIRHRQCLESASGSLSQALATVASGEPIDFLSVDLAAARNSLGLITGETATDDLLDRIFSEFCIGK